MEYRFLFPITRLRQKNSLSERALAALAGISRRCLRQVAQNETNVTTGSIRALALALSCQVEIIAAPTSRAPEFSTIATVFKVQRDGFDSWKVHFMDLVDEFRRSLDPRLILLAPPCDFDRKLTALMASLVRYLCEEVGLEPPSWALKRYYLDTPWFVAGMESLKAGAILESPLAFRNNNIFVQENFAERV